MRVVPDTFSAEECEASIKYGVIPRSRWCLIFESEQEAEQVKLFLEELMLEKGWAI